LQNEHPTALEVQDEQTVSGTDAYFFRRVTADEHSQRECNERYRQRHGLVHAMAREGKSRSAIARMTQLDRKTVRTILSQSEYTGIPQRGQRLSPIDSFKDYIAQRMADGCLNANQLFGELREKGFTGVYSTVWRMVRRLIRQSPALVSTSLTAASVRAQPAIPTVFEITRWLLDKSHALTAQQLTLVQAWVDASPELQAGRNTARRFTEILTERRADQLDAWIADALVSTVGVVQRFAKGIQADHDAVQAAMQLPWSTAQLEGQINRLKVIKRQMYGRAKFDLLKIRVMTKV
jgi:transposase